MPAATMKAAPASAMESTSVGASAMTLRERRRWRHKADAGGHGKARDQPAQLRPMGLLPLE